MKPADVRLFIISLLLLFTYLPGSASAQIKVKTGNGTVEGTTDNTGLRIFKGVPFAAPPIGELRWQPPQPVKNWQGTFKADHFGPRCMQRPIFSDMVFRSDGMSEDCLYLNVWTPAKSAKDNPRSLSTFTVGDLTPETDRSRDTKAQVWRARESLP